MSAAHHDPLSPDGLARYATEGARFLGVAPPGHGAAGAAHAWTLPLHAGLTGGKGGLFGGCGVGAAITGLEARGGRPLQWITTQFLTAAAPPDVLEFAVTRAVEGRNVSQVVAEVCAVGVDGAPRPVLAVSAALGARPGGDERRYRRPPAVAPPQDCDPAEPIGGGSGGGGLRDRFDIRQVDPQGGPPTETGRTSWWVGAGGIDVAAPELLAVAVDFVPFGLTAALGRPVFGASLDNTLRLVEREAADWVLVETAVDAIVSGIGQVSARVWSPGGALLALATQTCVVSERPPPVEGVR